MIGHVFDSSGAVCLAIAPSSRLGDYLVLAHIEDARDFDEYVVASISIHDLVNSEGKPDHWMEGSYFRDIAGAVSNFAERVGITNEAALLDQVRYAQGRVARGKSVL
jgi:hypothetical protein